MLTASQLVYFAWSWFPMSNTHKYPLYTETPEIATLRSLGQKNSTYLLREVISGKQYMLINNENIMYNLREITGFESVIPRCLYLTLGHWPIMKEINSGFLGKFNVGTLVTEYPLSSASLSPFGKSGPLWTYNNLTVRPRATFAHSSVVLLNDTAILRHLLDTVGGWPVAFFTPNQHSIGLAAVPNASDSISEFEDHGNEILMHAKTRDSAYLILTDTYYPGWQCTVDKNDVTVLRCNYAMRAILVPPGEHNIELRFSPTSFRIGSWISMGTFCFLAFGLFWSRKKQIRG